MKRITTFSMILTLILFGAGLLIITGCSEETPLEPTSGTDGIFTQDSDSEKGGQSRETQDGSIIPGDLVDIDSFGTMVTCWPFTGAKLDGVPMDPVNLVFTGYADPVQIRAALLGLNGDRSMLGLPDAFPFNQIWKDALGGGVQSNYEVEGGWRGGVIQLTLGEYEPVRFHLRLFRTGAVDDNGLPITLGAAHFEVLIPGTTDHQVLSWNAARDIVVGDMMRTGLLNPATDLMPTQQITPAPTFRTIIPAVYNGLPAELLAMIGGPAPPVSEPVGIPNDGTAMVVRLAGPAVVTPGVAHASTTVEFGQFVPRPYCSDGPYDYLWIEGPVYFESTYTVDEFGAYSYEGGYQGDLVAVPVNPSTGEAIGDPFYGDVYSNQSGWLNMSGAKVRVQDKKITYEGGRPQQEHIQLMIGEKGADKYKGYYKCLDDQ